LRNPSKLLATTAYVTGSSMLKLPWLMLMKISKGEYIWSLYNSDYQLKLKLAGQAVGRSAWMPGESSQVQPP